MAKDGRKVRALESRPKIGGWEMSVWNAFMLLHSQRQVGFAPCPIAIADISALLDVWGIAESQRMEFVELLLVLDSEWLAWARSRSNDGHRS